MAADLNAVVLIQAHVRSFLVRKKLLKVRKEFEEVFAELEKSAEFVRWKKEGFGRPLISSDPKVLNDVNEKTKLASRENGNEATRSRGRVKEGFCNGELSSDADQNEDGFSSDTEKYSLGNRNFNVAGLQREKVDEGRISDYEDPILERTAISERYDEDLQQNHGFLADNGTNSLQGQKQKEEQTFPGKKSQQKLISLGLSAEMTNCECGDDKCPHKLSNPPCSSFPLSSTLRDTSIDEQVIKETVGHDSKSETSLQGYVYKRLHLRDQAILSDSWLTDRSFVPVETEETTTELPTDPVKLRELRDHIGMELLWTEQAMQSRKKYLALRKGLAQADHESNSTVNWE